MRDAAPLALRLSREPAGRGTTSPDGGVPGYIAPADPGSEPAAKLRRGGFADPSARAVSPGDERDFPNRVHGRVFATYPEQGDFTCSATVVNAPGRSLVLSAGHCVYSAGAWATNWMFVPGYRDGNAPFGRWVATELRATEQWKASEALSFDIGTATLGRDATGRGIQDAVGARGIGFNQPRNQTYMSYGYPAEPPFDGESLQSCTSPYGGDDTSSAPPRTMRIDCDMNGGSSGGGWVAGDLVLSLNSYCNGLILICTDLPMSLFGPYFGDDAETLYRASRGRAAKCAGSTVTQLGGAGAQSFTGSGGRDTISLGAGADSAAGRSGRDTLCGGKGRDVLRGGPGRDVCIGGPGKDKARGCEVRLQIP